MVEKEHEMRLKERISAWVELGQIRGKMSIGKLRDELRAMANLAVQMIGNVNKRCNTNDSQ